MDILYSVFSSRSHVLLLESDVTEYKEYWLARGTWHLGRSRCCCVPLAVRYLDTCTWNQHSNEWATLRFAPQKQVTVIRYIDVCTWNKHSNEWATLVLALKSQHNDSDEWDTLILVPETNTVMNELPWHLHWKANTTTVMNEIPWYLYLKPTQ